MARILLSSKKFGRLRVIRKVKPDIYLCQCTCGNTIQLWKSQLWCGVVRHCGCRLSIPEKLGMARFGWTQATRQVRVYYKRSGSKCTRTTWEYNSWNEMNLRCYCSTRNPEMWANYGARGIRVCERWRRGNKNAFKNFLADMGPRPQGTSLDRINPQGHYEPTNCRWATSDVQHYNQRRFLFKDRTPPPVEKVSVMEQRVDEWTGELPISTHQASTAIVGGINSWSN